LHIKSKNYSRAARLHLDARQNEDALRLLLRAGDHTSAMSLRTLLAIAYFRLDKIDKGLEQAKDIISMPISMDTIEVQYEYASALYEQGNFNQAMEIFQAIVSLAKDYKKARQYLNWIAAVNEEVQAELGETIVGELPIGLTINNRYELMKLIGKGAVGIVYQAADRELNISVALKILRPKYSYDPDIIEMIKREVTLARMLAHPNIIKIYDLNRAGNIWFVSMEYLQGEELKARLRRQGPYPVPELVAILDQILSALIHSHRAKVIHADIKPANIFINNDNQITLVDFGIARAAGSFTEDQLVSGTPEYISPEQIRGDPPTPRSDLYSLGISLYELTTGRLPFRGHDMKQILEQQLNSIPPSPIEIRPDTPPWLNQMILKLMKKNPLERYENASAVQQDLPKSS
jgi:tRNA A-37 threonylcarbamoyl transferase component Bud32